MTQPVTQRGGIITGFLLRTVIIFAVLGLSVYEAGAIIVAKVAVDEVAREAAREAAISYSNSDGSTSKAKNQCRRLAARSGATCVSVRISDGYLHVRVRKEAPTLIVQRIGPLKSLTVSTADAREQIT